MNANGGSDSRFDQDGFNAFVLDHGILEFFDEAKTLASGRQSHWYVNWRRALQSVGMMDTLIDYVIGFALENDIEPDQFYGVQALSLVED